MVVKHLLQKGWCEPASGKENSLLDCCEGVGVLPSEGGNTSAYLETERYRSMPFQLSACHSQKAGASKMSENGTTESVCLRYTVVCSALTALILPSVRGLKGLM